MHIDRLRISDFRCFKQLDIRPSTGINVVVGENASGKSSLLEALFLLGRGHSFRQSSARDSIREGADRFTVVADIGSEQGRGHRLAVSCARSNTQFRRDGETHTTRLDLVSTLPLQLIDPNVHRLLEQGPRYRRHFMDWGVFHVEQIFFPAWRRYRRALKQRNRALKARAPKTTIIAWDAELVHQGEIVDACRRAHVADLGARLPESAHRVLGGADVDLSYHPGWTGDDGFGAALAAGLARDQKAGFTQFGPHRADLRMTLASGSVRDWVSRGQQKVLTAALLLAQARLIRDRRNVVPVLLVDDLVAELGEQYRNALGKEVQDLGLQSFLTFLDPALVPKSLKPAAMFHVEQGCVVPVDMSPTC